jgi:hypothetical protein
LSALERRNADRNWRALINPADLRGLWLVQSQQNRYKNSDGRRYVSYKKTTIRVVEPLVGSRAIGVRGKVIENYSVRSSRHGS